MKKVTKRRQPSRESLRALPEVDLSRFRRGRRGKYAHLLTGDAAHAVVIDANLWEHYGSAKAVNDALRMLVDVAARTSSKRTAAKAKARTAA